MRKLYRTVKKTCGVSTAIELRTQSGGAVIVKDDRKLTTAAITGSTELLLRILPTPDIFTIFVTLPGHNEQSTILIEEVCLSLHVKVTTWLASSYTVITRLSCFIFMAILY